MSRPMKVFGLVLWVLLGLAGSVLAVWAFPRLYPFVAQGWRLDAAGAAERAGDAFAALGEPVEDAYVVVVAGFDLVLEKRLLPLAGGNLGRAAELVASRLGHQVRIWHVIVYPPGAEPEDFAYFGRISAAGDVLSLERRVERGAASGEVDPDRAGREAEALLRRTGLDPADFGEPALRRLERPDRTDLALRFRDVEPVPGGEIESGVEIEYQGDLLTGLSLWRDREGEEEIVARLKGGETFLQARFLGFYFLLAVVGVAFVRRYNEGVLEVRRAVRLFLLLFTAGFAFIALTARGAAGMIDYDISRRLTTWVFGFQLLILAVVPLALLAALAWTVGEANCRQLWGAKLAAFDAVLRGRFASATVGRAAFRGLAAGLGLAGGLLALLLGLARLGAEPLAAYTLGAFYPHAPWPGLAMLLFHLLGASASILFLLLFLLPRAVGRFGIRIGGAAVALVSAVFVPPPVATLPGGVEMLASLLAVSVIIVLFLRHDLLTAFLAALTSGVALASLPYLFAESTGIIAQGVVPLVLLALPLLLSLRGSIRGEEAVYHFDVVPPHVRRIAERERLRFELETARRIQSSILPDLPPYFDGIEVDYAYRPATEVGGDFYEVAELPGGRLALAVGDVAGHGVASGLVMAMARSALASQVEIDPSVEAVFRTLNRILHDTARKSLLTTLCYGLLEPSRDSTSCRELRFASAGHLFPYVVGAGGAVRWLESVAYPLGVRRVLEIRPNRVELRPGDTLVLVSDGIVEARSDGSDEPYGFDRFAASLAHHAGAPPPSLKEALLGDVDRFTGGGAREDDQTVLVMRLAEHPATAKEILG